MSSEGRERALAGNETAQREVNEAIERGRWPGEEERAAYRCECAQRGCTSMLELTRAQYEELRAHPRRFCVIAGHENPEVEAVVGRERGFLLVEKRGEAGRVSEVSDPRS
ncbi:MAG TPA: hypothetical protein VGN13_04825 [Solirubrobacteraceae bacterium]